MADGTPVATSAMGGITARAAYATMARWGVPGVPADSPAFARIAQVISDARRDAGDHPDGLTFGCEPTDFAEPGCPAWQVFDTTVASNTTTTTTTTAEPVPGDRLMARTVNRDLWKVRALPEAVLADLPRRRLMVDETRLRSAQLAVLPHELAVDRIRMSPALPAAPADGVAAAHRSASAVAEGPVSAIGRLPSRPLLDRAVRRSATALSAERIDMRSQLDVQSHPVSEIVGDVQLVPVDDDLVRDLANVGLSDLVEQPALTTVTTSTSSLHVHFEYILLTITRRIAGTSWWHPELMAEPSWYVPGMKRGAMVPESTEPGYEYCLPQSLLLVRNVSLTGVWSDEARAAMSGAVHYFGPFLMTQPAQSTQAATTVETTILGLGVQVIAELCGPLPALPPMDSPG